MVDDEPITTPELEAVPAGPVERHHLIARLAALRQLAADYHTFAGSHALVCRCRECFMARSIPALANVVEVAVKIDKTSVIPDENQVWRTLHWALEALERVLAEG